MAPKKKPQTVKKVSKSRPVVEKEVEEIEVTEETTEEEQQDDGWGAGAVTRAIPQLQIETHTGRFNEAEMKMLVYAESGTGKTRFTATFPDALIVDTDHGLASVDWEVDNVRINNFHQAEDVYQFLLNGEHQYETVVIDTLNELQRMAMASTIDDFPQVRRSYSNLPSMADYGKMLNDFMNLTRNFIALPMRVILVAQVKSREYEDEVLMPQLTGKQTARELARKMDLIGYMYNVMDDTESLVPAVTFSSPDYVTKDRSNLLPVEIQSPTYELVAQYL